MTTEPNNSLQATRDVYDSTKQANKTLQATAATLSAQRFGIH